MVSPLTDAHCLPAEDIYSRLNSSASGLSSAEALIRLEIEGPNTLPATQQKSWWQRLAQQFNDPMIYVLIAAGILTALLGQVVDTIVIAAVVIINGLVGFIQEGKAADALASIRSMLSPTSEVRRDGQWVSLDSANLVLGDVVRLRSGDKVPADVRLVEATSLRIEESALTGESLPVSKATQSVDKQAALGDRQSMAYSGTTVAAGTGVGVITATGSDTQIGAITQMLDEVEEIATPLTRAMAKFSSHLAILVVILALIMVAVNWLLYQTDWIELFMSAIGFAVAAIPEGLPAVMAITLALGVQKMAGHKAITRRMNSVETLGSVTTICSDKTGTLTRNEMTVRAVVTAADSYEVSGTGYNPEGSVEGDVAASPTLRALAQVAAYATEAQVVHTNGHWVLQGEPTDGAIYVFALKAGQDFQSSNAHRLSAVPFDSEYKYQASLNEVDGQYLIHLKGAPDRLLERCTTQLGADGQLEPLDKELWSEYVDALGARGLRVLAAAVREEREYTAAEIDTETIDTGGFTFIGLYGLIDPPREEAIEAVKTVQEAGIRVRMITGDHASTATAIAQEIGIAEGQTLTGSQIEELDDEELRKAAVRATIFARTSPKHKLRLVRALQANGEVVSMTGDGVNDAPSLKQADVGVAMGIKGTEATKDAADIVLADDNFATIAAAVHMGRTIFDNLRKAIMFMLPTNGAQGLVILAAMIFGMTLPLTPLQVLWVNLITSITLSLALSFEPSEPGTMTRPPRDPDSGLIPTAGVVRIIYVSLLLGLMSMGAFMWANSNGYALELSRTLAVNTLVVAQIFYFFTARFEHVSALRPELFSTNPISWVCVAVMVILQLVFVYTPFMQTAFGTAAVSLQSWIIPLAAGIIVFVVVEVDKAVRR